MSYRWKISYLFIFYLALTQLSFASEKELKRAIVVDDITLARSLISAGLNVNKVDRIVGAPLHYAAVKGSNELIVLLLDSGADIEVLTKMHPKKQAIHLAAGNGHMETISILLDKGADVNASSSRGTTALHEAVVGGFTDVVKLLLEMGADIHSVDEDKGWTPLHQSVRLKSSEISSLLLDFDANPNARDLKGHTALRVLLSTISLESSESSDDHSLILKLLDRGAKVDNEDDDWAGMIGTIDDSKLIQLIKAKVVH